MYATYSLKSHTLQIADYQYIYFTSLNNMHQKKPVKPLSKSVNCWSCCNLQDLVMPNLSSPVRPSKIAHRCQQEKIIPPHGPNFSVDKLFLLKGDIYQFGHHHCHRGSTSLEVWTLEQCTEPGVSYHCLLLRFYYSVI